MKFIPAILHCQLNFTTRNVKLYCIESEIKGILLSASNLTAPNYFYTILVKLQANEVCNVAVATKK